jgi:hypothetical protein
MATKTKIICVVCGEETEKPAAEIKRQKKEEKQNFIVVLNVLVKIKII